MTCSLPRILLLTTALLVATQAGASPIMLVGTFSGAAESPGNSSPGTGSAVVIIDPTAHTMSIEVEFSGLLAPTTVAHIHCCTAPGTNAGVATTTPTFPGFPAGVTSGTFSATFDMLSAASYNPSFITNNGGSVASAEAALFAGLIGGLAYFNIHTSQFPAGELRANLSVPEPSTPFLAGLALLSLALLRRAAPGRRSAAGALRRN